MPTLTPGNVLSSIELVNVSNRPRWSPLLLAAERSRLHLITGRSGWRVRSERRTDEAGCRRSLLTVDLAGRLSESSIVGRR
jgi:hypothetical protein